MAQTITCDYQGAEPHMADVLVSRITPGANGETLAWCDPHYVEVCQAIAAAVADQEAGLADDAAVASLEASGPTTSPASSDADGAPDDKPGLPPDGETGTEGTETPPEPEPAATGRSRRSQGHQAEAAAEA